MTVAAFDGHQLVIDGMMSWGNMPMQMAGPKAIVCGSWVIAMAGETRHTFAVQYTLLKDVRFDEDELPRLPPLVGDDPKFEAMAASSTRLCFYQGSPFPVELDMKMMAIGSGCDLAMGAMAQGADALTAVRTAITYDTQCGPPIYAYRYNKKTGTWNVDRIEV